MIAGEILAADFDRVEPKRLSRLCEISGLSSTVSDLLDQLGWALAVPATVLVPRNDRTRPIIGHAVTLRYLPERRSLRTTAAPQHESKLAHSAAFDAAGPGDIVVVEARTDSPVSVMGGNAASEGTAKGLGGAVVDGAVRDLDEISAADFPVWSRFVTPVTGKYRLEAITINGAVDCGGVQVRPGDLVVADHTGVCFVPAQIADEIVARVLSAEPE
jgi:4-hydroxy-4-methyl-2-oxoglutarate aldolase